MNSKPATTFLNVVLLTVAFLMIAGSAQAAKYRAIEPIEITDDAADSSVELVGYLFIPDKTRFPNPPLVVLLHEQAESHVVWNDFAQELANEGFAAFGMDLRGYGLSIYDLKRKTNRPKNTFYGDEILRYPHDIRQLVEKVFAVSGKDLDTTKIAVIGAQLGANAGLIYADIDARVKYTALISPGLEYRGLNIAAALRNYGDRPLYLATSSKDIYSHESCNLLSDVSPRVLDLDVFDGFLYGTKLVYSSMELQKRLIGDLRKHLK